MINKDFPDYHATSVLREERQRLYQYSKELLALGWKVYYD